MVIYYRRPYKTRDGRDASNPGYITWADSLSGSKLVDYETRGFTPLRKYGAINSVARTAELKRRTDEGEVISQAERLWGPILSHPDGPSEFTKEQIFAMRWHKPEDVPVKGTVFPQLQGEKIRELKCPECSRAAFIDHVAHEGVMLLGIHLRIHHNWDRTALNAYGDRKDIDFNDVDSGGGLVQETTFGEAPVAPDMACSQCDETFEGKMAAARKAKHEKTHVALEVSTV